MSEGTCMSVNLFDEVGYVQGLRASLTDLYQKPDDEQTKAEINNLIQQIRNYEEKWKRFFGVYSTFLDCSSTKTNARISSYIISQLSFEQRIGFILSELCLLKQTGNSLKNMGFDLNFNTGIPDYYTKIAEDNGGTDVRIKEVQDYLTEVLCTIYFDNDNMIIKSRLEVVRQVVYDMQIRGGMNVFVSGRRANSSVIKAVIITMVVTAITVLILF